MKKPDEIALLREILSAAGNEPYECVDARQIAERLGMPPKRLEYILLKWPWWEYGTVHDKGWLSPDGIEDAREEAEKDQRGHSK